MILPGSVLMADRFVLKQQAYESFWRMMQAARDCRAAFDAAHEPLPDLLRGFLGEVAVHPENPDGPFVVVPPIEAPARPPEFQTDWIWVPIQYMTPTSLVGGVLRGAGGQPKSPGEIVEAIEELGVSANRGSIANIGTRLATSGEIAREGGSWTAITPEKFPVLCQRNAWGPPSVFDKVEVAAHRRLCILHVLRVHHDGLQVLQITRTLEKCDWMRAPLDKDLVKTDLQVLQSEQRAKRIGHSGKWRAA